MTFYARHIKKHMLSGRRRMFQLLLSRVCYMD